MVYHELVFLLGVFKSFVEDVAHDIVRRQIILTLGLLLQRALMLMHRVLVCVQGVQSIDFFKRMVGVEHLLVVRNHP
jgi:hypothetical protein